MDELKFRGNPRLATARLILRRLKTSDAPDMFEYASDQEVARYVMWDAHKALDDSLIFIMWTLDRYQKDEAGEWGIELKESSRLIGSMGFVKLDEANSCASIGYALANRYWGQGIMTEAVERLIEFAFGEMNLNRVEAVHFLPNEASGRVMQKAGMKYEGILRQRMYSKNKYWDVKQYAIIREDWESRKGAIMMTLSERLREGLKEWEADLGHMYGIPSAEVADISDLEEILSLQQLAYQSEATLYNDFNIPPLTQTIQSVKEEAQKSVILKLSEGGRIIGSVRAYEKEGTCYIGKLMVHPDYQNRGLAKKLMAAIERCFEGLRYELFTGYLSEKNLALYEKLGYKRFKIEKAADNLEFIFLEKC